MGILGRQMVSPALGIRPTLANTLRLLAAVG
jgi:hypothetical protein